MEELKNGLVYNIDDIIVVASGVIDAVEVYKKLYQQNFGNTEPNIKKISLITVNGSSMAYISDNLFTNTQD